MKFNKPYFENICNIGDLFLDKIFFEFENIPILFLCRDKSSNMYLCLCSEIRKVQRWIICKVSKKTLADMLKDEITIRQAFELSGNELYILHYTKADGLSSEILSLDKISEEDLPDKDEYLEDRDSFEDFIKELTEPDWNIKISLNGNNCTYTSVIFENTAFEVNLIKGKTDAIIYAA